MQIRSFLISTALFAGALLFGLSSPVKADTITVCASGCNQTTISAAMGAALEGDIVEVQSTYDPAGESFSINFPNASTTLTCTGGATIGQASPTGNNSVFLSTSSTITGCTFGNINLRSVSLTSTPVSGIRITNNVFSSSATGSIDLVYGSNSFEISGNTNINVLHLGATSTNGMIQNNTFYGRMSGLYNATMLLTHTTSSNLRIINNTFTNYSTSANGSGRLIHIGGSDHIFATNTIKYAADFTSDVDMSAVFAASGTNYIGGNFIESPSIASCKAVMIYAESNNPWTATYNIHRNTIVNRGSCTNGQAIGYSDNYDSASIIPTIRATYNLLYNAVSSVSSQYAIHLSLQPSSVMNQTNQYNGAYGYAGVIATEVGGGGGATDVSSATSRTGYPFLKRADASSSNDLETAAFSPYLDVNGTTDIGATEAVRRTTIYIDDNGTIDYSSVDATSTYDVASIARTGDSFVLAAGSYERINVNSSYATSSLSFTGAGATTIINAGTNQDAITLTNATSVTISAMKVQGATSAGSSTYSTTRINLTYGGTHYNEAMLALGIMPGTMLVANDLATCDLTAVTSDGASITSIPGVGSTNLHLALITVGDGVGIPAKLTLLLSDSVASTRASLDSQLAAGCGGMATTTAVLLISNVFTLSGSTYSLQESALTDAGVTISPGATDPPAISSVTTLYGGIKFTNVNNSTISSVTSTANRYGIIFDANSGGNTVSDSVFSSNTAYDVSLAGYATNTFDNVSFNRTSSTVSGVGPLLVKYKVRAQTLRATNSAAVSGAAVSLVDDSAQTTSLGSTNGSGYTSFTSVPAHRITASSASLTNGAFNPNTLSTLVTGYAVSSTSVTLSAVNTTVTIYLTPTSTPAAPSSPTVSLGTTTSTLSWTDNADHEDGFIVDIINLSTGDGTFPGTTTTAAADATSYAFSGLTPNMTYMARVQATTTAYGYSAYATSSAFTTKASVPGAPAVSAASRTSVTVTIDANGNSTSTKYAIYSATLGGYLNALGVASASPTWQTTSTWSTLTVSDLTCNTAYSFSVIARNLDLVLTATSTESSVTTSACASSGSSGGGGGGSGSGSSIGSPALFSFTAPTALPSSAPVTSAPVAPAPIATTPTPSSPAEPVSPPSTAPVLPPASETTRLVIERDARQFGVQVTDAQEERLAAFIEFGTSDASRRLGSGERNAVIRDLMQTLGSRINALPLEDVERVIAGQPPLTRNLEAERLQLARTRQTFRTIYGHDPNFRDAEENLAWNTLMYRIRFPRDLAAEREGITEFRRLFGRAPQDPFQWATVRVLGYVER